MKLGTIKDILQDLFDNCEEMSKSKFSGVHFVNGTYRIHEGVIIPRAFATPTVWNDMQTVIDICFPNTMLWDKQSLWLTINKPTTM